MLLILHAGPVHGQAPSDRCARDVFRAAGLAARDVVRAQAPPDPSKPEASDAALTKARKRLERRLAKAMHRGICAAPVDVDAIWDLTRRLGTDLALTVSVADLTGSWTLTGDTVAGGCADGAPVFADALEIVEQDGFLEATATSASYTGGVDGDQFDLSVVYGAIDCGAGGLYDLDLQITGTRLTPSTYRVIQRSSHATIVGTCPACDVTWAGTMTRAPTP